ncbi:MAG TPA: hypothetical protein VIY48_05985 [Candidatus Paceibacterota bacterium]
MFALETRQLPGNTPNPASLNPWHPETHQGFDQLNVLDLPLAEERPANSRWIPTGFRVTGSDEFIRATLKDRFFHNPALGFAFGNDGMVVEYEYQPQRR